MQRPEGIDWKKRLRPKAYAIGIYVVGFFILVELAVLGSAFWMRQRVVLETEGPAVEEPLLGASMEEPPTLPQPVPTFEARLNPAQGPTVAERVAKLNDEATGFRRSGSFPLAEAALAQALEIDPENTLTLTNFAMLEEARGNNAKALGYWKRIIGMGDRARDTVQLARERSVILEERLRLEEESRRRAQISEATVRKVALVQVRTRPDPLPPQPRDIERDFVLKVSANGPPLQGNKIRIQVYFYDRVGGDRLATVPIEARFLNDPPVWGAGSEEILRVRYQAAADGEKRTYYGYLFRVFYDGILQDERAEPASLLRVSAAR